MKKLVRITAVLALIIVVLGSCSQKKTSSKPLQFIWFSDGNEGEVMKTMLAEYEKESGQKIELVEVAYKDSVAKIQAMIQGGEAPALARVSALPVFAKDVVDLKGVIDLKDYSKASTHIIDDKTNSKILGLPLDSSANGMIYNKTLFTKYNVNLPKDENSVWTWETFEKEMEKLKGQSDVKYPGLYDFTPFRFGSMAYQYGAKIMDKEKPAVNSKEFIKATQNFADLHANGILDPTIWAGSGDPASLFSTGQYGFHIGGSWLIQNYGKLPFEWGVTYMPKGENPEGIRATSGGGKFIAAFNGSKQESEAKDFIKWFAKKENHFKFSQQTYLINPRLDGEEVKFDKFADQYKVFSNELLQIPSVMIEDATNPAIESVYPLLKAAVANAVTNPKDVEKIMNELAKTIETETKK